MTVYLRHYEIKLLIKILIFVVQLLELLVISMIPVI